jgi:replication factor A1
VALWGEKADLDIGPGDEVLFADVEIQEGWQDELEASAGWRATVVPLGDGETAVVETGEDATEEVTESGSANLESFADGEGPAVTLEGETDSESHGGTTVEFTGVVVQAGDPIILDDGQRTVTVERDLDVVRGETVTLSGELSDGRLIPEESP